MLNTINIADLGLGLNSVTVAALVVIMAVWETVWKALGLWHAAQARHKAWFIVILIVNTIGILPIIYLLIQRRNNKSALPPSRRSRPAI